MSGRICGERCRLDGRLMICCLSPDHNGDHSWRTARAKERRRLLKLVATIDGLSNALPAGGYTDQVKEVHVRGNTVVITFNTAYVETLIERRKRDG